ncbi:CDP-alcohol phosphatidyltransferase [Microbacterium sp. SSM24]|uniref:CDP-alcohol phosphatidyltransferase n=1 Tax=Microbacterium sp. SSM24 TaxID=2991714 RepID=UPI0022277451|nr:CDP-alcohol phosphatidyltransferase [Microbacterium sp. SSM24]MCW3493143.1 CDP-alcohol phosphatidyltransferase [Microbacterium sp. SSM24]
MNGRSDPGFAGARGSRRAAVLTALAVATLVLVPLVPGVLGGEGAAALAGIPGESIVVVLVLLLAVRRPLRIAVALGFGVVVVLAILIAALDLAFRLTIDRPFNPVDGGKAIADGYGVVADAMGQVGAASAVVAVALVAVAVVAGVSMAAMRVGGAVGGGPRGRMLVAGIAAGWIVLALAGARITPDVPVAASRSADELVTTTERAVTSVQELQAFDRAIAVDPLAAKPADELFTALRGKDVLMVFVEAYGRVALEPASFTAPVERALSDGGDALAGAGFSARSAFLTSPTFGGVSWLAHSTLQSGAWADSPLKYTRLLDSDRRSLSELFGTAGWHTMSVVPSNERPWEAGRDFYGFDTMLDERNMGYRGPHFGYAHMPDQFTWSVFRSRRSDIDGPMMAEVDLVSSHTPWTPLPQLVPWSQLGDGRVFAGQAASGESASDVWGDRERVQKLYGESVAYTLGATFSYLETFAQPDLVLVLVGDHQPWQIVSGEDAGHDVPVTIIAQDPAVFDAIASWGWEDGVHPSPAAPVWRMDAFRDRFVAAFSD